MTEDMKKYMDAYILETEEHLQHLNDSLLKLEKQPKNKETINQLFRSAHTLKSSSATMGFKHIAELSHAIEDVLGEIKNNNLPVTGDIITVLFHCVDKLESIISTVTKGGKEDNNVAPFIKKLQMLQESELTLNQEKPTGEDSEGETLAAQPHLLKQVHFVKISMKRLDRLMNLVGELLINKMQLQRIKEEKKLKDLTEPINHLDRLATDIQFEVTQSRLVPVEQIFNRFPRMVRDLAQKEGKIINFTIETNNIELDRTVIDQIGEPLIHLLRNAVDHGIEPPNERKKAGKQEQGTITLTAQREKNAAIIKLHDDGKGLNIDEIKKVAIKRNIKSEQEIVTMPEQKILNLVYDPRLSTAQKITEVSGRGVGLDVVKTKIESLSGSVLLTSTPGKGVTFILELPLTLAIIQCFLVKINTAHYAIPLANVIRTVKVEKDNIKTIEGHETFILNKENIPLLHLPSLFNMRQQKATAGSIVVIIEKASEKAGIVVDSIIGKQELIIKPLDKTLKDTKGFSGCTILGDGSVALIIDLNTII